MFEKIMERPLVYNLWSSLHFLPRLREITQAMQENGHPRILDLGCGTGLFKKYYPDCSYVGIDINARYIDHARRNITGHFILGDMLKLERHIGSSRFNHIIANGVLHHLDDIGVTTLMKQVGPHLASGGSIIVVDHLYHERLRPINKMLLHLDRGSYRRTEAHYRGLFQDFTIASYKEFSIKAGTLVLWVQCRFVLHKP